MKKLTSILLLIFLATTACSNSISDLEDKIEAQAAKNNVEMSYAEHWAAPLTQRTRKTALRD